MKETLDAIYENGVLRPLGKLDVAEGQRLRIILETMKDEDDRSIKDKEKKRHRFSDLAGCLSTSARFSRDPVDVHRELRNEWS